MKTKAGINRWLAEEFLGWEPGKNIWHDPMRGLQSIQRRKLGFHNEIFVLSVGDEDFFNPEGLAMIKKECIRRKLIVRSILDARFLKGAECGYFVEVDMKIPTGTVHECEYTAFYTSLMKAFKTVKPNDALVNDPS